MRRVAWYNILMKNFIKFIILLVFIFVLWMSKVVLFSQNGDKEVRPVEIAQGESLTQITINLQKAGIVQNKTLFVSYIRLKGVAKSIKAGTHNLPGNLSVRSLVNNLISGATIENEMNITILEGWNLRDIASMLKEAKVISSDQELFSLTGFPAQTNPTLSLLPESIYIPAGNSLEGVLFPDTYRVYKNSKPGEVLSKILDNFDQKMADLAQVKNESGLSPYEVLTLASIVAKEGKTLEDKKMVAGIFLNRLRDSIALRSDATVNYLTQKVTDNPSLKDLDVDSMYNTYMYRGLPPGPISNPGADDILAVRQPTKSNYFYFLNTKEGKLIYSKTFEEHVANRVKYDQ